MKTIIENASLIDGLAAEPAWGTNLLIENGTIAEIGPERAVLTHLTHRLDHDELAADLPAGVEPAYDGLVIEI